MGMTLLGLVFPKILINIYSGVSQAHTTYLVISPGICASLTLPDNNKLFKSRYTHSNI